MLPHLISISPNNPQHFNTDVLRQLTNRRFWTEWQRPLTAVLLVRTVLRSQPETRRCRLFAVELIDWRWALRLRLYKHKLIAHRNCAFVFGNDCGRPSLPVRNSELPLLPSICGLSSSHCPHQEHAYLMDRPTIASAASNGERDSCTCITPQTSNMASPVLELSRDAQIPGTRSWGRIYFVWWSLIFVDAACHYFGSWNTEMTPRFLENIWPSV